MKPVLSPGAKLLRLQLRHTEYMEKPWDDEIPIDVVYVQPDGTEIVTDFITAGTIIEAHHINDLRWRLP